MNSRFFYLFLMMTLIAGCAQPSMILQDVPTDHIIHYSQMNTIENISNYVVYLNKGDHIPVTMTLESDILDILHEDIHLILKQKVYFRVSIPEGINAEHSSAMNEEEQQKFLKNVKIYLSSDAKRWAPYTNINAVGRIFGLTGGSFSFNMGITKEDGISIFLNGKTQSM